MKIRTRITLYNLTVIFLSLFVLSFIIGFAIRRYENTIYTIDNLTVDENVSIVEDIVNDINAVSDKTNEESQELLNEYNYKLFIYGKEDRLIYGNLKDVTTGLVKVIINYDYKDEIRSLYVDSSTMVIKKLDEVLIIAMKSANETSFLGTTGSHFRIFYTKFFFACIITIALIIFIASSFSNKVIKRLMKPVDILTKGTKKIKEGNLDEPIKYTHNDEFSILFDNFNKMQVSLKEEKEKNIKFEKSKKEIINGLSHDIRTPLTSVKGYIKGTLDGVASTSEKREKYLSTAYQKTIDIEKLLDKLFDTYNIEAVSINKERCELHDFIDTYIKSHEAELALEKIKINLNNPSIKIYLNIDKDSMIRVLNNLLGNAIKYAKEDDLVIDITIWEDEKNAHINFKDNGKGVTSSEINKIFEEFWREDESRTGNKGNGLGLYIVKSIIDSHDGEIFAKNKKGLMIEILLPKEDANE